MKCNNFFKQFPLKNFVIYDINGVEKKNLCCPDCKKLENNDTHYECKLFKINNTYIVNHLEDHSCLIL